MGFQVCTSARVRTHAFICACVRVCVCVRVCSKLLEEDNRGVDGEKLLRRFKLQRDRHPHKLTMSGCISQIITSHAYIWVRLSPQKTRGLFRQASWC